MKLKALSIIFMTVLACSCERGETDQKTEPSGELTVNPEKVFVSSDASEQELTITSDSDWGISSDNKEWVTVFPSGGIAGTSTVKVNVKKNTTGSVRETSLTIRCGSSRITIPVKQNYDVVGVEIPDAAFKSCLLQAYDEDNDGVLSTKEAAAVTKIEAAGRGIKDMSGLSEKFPNLTYLDCSDNELVDLDLSGLVALAYLDCSDNDLSSIDISIHVNLEYFDATGNENLTSIYVWTGFTASENFSKPESAEYVEPEINTPAGYKLVWQEEFNESATGLPDTKKWWYETAEPGWVNNELQTYIAGRKGDIVTADVSNGSLKIRAIKEGNRVYSARVNTNEGWTYGYFEARLKLPRGKGTWPAFWMMPTVWSGWPDGGEIDIMEHVGCVPTEVSSSIHCKEYYHAIGTQKTAAKKIATVMDEFHVYALEWTEEYIKTYVDGVQLFYYNPDNYSAGRNERTWPFNKPFQLKLNLAWGGDWGGMYGVDESCLPATYEIDYVRVFQKP